MESNKETQPTVNNLSAAELVSTNEASVNFDVALKELASLSTRANGVSISKIEVPAELKGLPPHVPILMVRGESPTAGSLSDLLEEYRMFPDRKQGTASVQTLESFISLTDRHATPHSAIFADVNWREPSLLAVIDYHPDDEDDPHADNCTHRIYYKFPLSEEWAQWVENNGEKMMQSDFALWIEDHIADLAAPNPDEIQKYQEQFQTTIATPSELMEISRGLQVNVSSQVKNAKTLQTGEAQIIYDESHQTTDRSGGTLKVPGMFILSIPAFFMGAPVRMPVRLRYRVNGGNITWFYQLYRPDLIITEAIKIDIATAKKALDLPVYEGKPEISA
ncbi:DUF2303 family protein [Ochrobactrum sp. MR28]|nr:DUF2303 family protein [Ochrobactrum sp. MR28]